MADLAIAFTISGQREKYLRQSLGSWAKVRGVQDAHLIFCVEPAGHFPVRDFDGWAHRVFASCEVVVNASVLNTLKNTRKAFDLAFLSGARFAILAEEDIEVADDVLEYLQWASVKYEGDSEVTTISAHSKDSRLVDAGAVTRASWFSPLICGTWKDRWENYIRPEYKGYAPTKYDNPDTSQAWDTNLRVQIRRDGKVSIFPACSRATHIGEFSTWMCSAVAEHIYPLSQSGSYYPHYPPQEYHEIPFDSVPGLLV
jgi:hypothetical protein